MSRKFDLWARPYWPRAFGGRVMRLRDDLRKTVCFIGHGNGESFVSRGSGFFLAYGGLQYLITARHIAERIGEDPFGIRVNRPVRGTLTWQADPLGEDPPVWRFPDDDSVDVAAMLFMPKDAQRETDAGSIPEELIASADVMGRENVGVGDICYAVGLFRLMAGRDRNLPFVHTGNIGMLPGDQTIPTRSWRNTGPRTFQTEGYLAEMTSIAGLSGSPIFARPTFGLRGAQLNDGTDASALLANEQVYLIGLWQGAWDGDPDDVTRHEVGDYKVPVRIGIVIPIEKVVSLLESPALKQEREALLVRRRDNALAKPD